MANGFQPGFGYWTPAGQNDRQTSDARIDNTIVTRRQTQVLSRGLKAENKTRVTASSFPRRQNNNRSKTSYLYIIIVIIRNVGNTILSQPHSHRSRRVNTILRLWKQYDLFWRAESRQNSNPALHNVTYAARQNQSDYDSITPIRLVVGKHRSRNILPGRDNVDAENRNGPEQTFTSRTTLYERHAREELNISDVNLILVVPLITRYNIIMLRCARKRCNAYALYFVNEAAPRDFRLFALSARSK